MDRFAVIGFAAGTGLVFAGLYALTRWFGQARDSPLEWESSARAILEALGEREMHSLEIAARCEGRVTGRSVYAWLDHMERAGLLESRIDASPAPGTFPRKLYRVRARA